MLTMAVDNSKALPDAEGWLEIGVLDDIPPAGARVVRTPEGDIAVFRTGTDQLYALRDACPHKGGPLSQGMVCDDTVTCPLHNWRIHLDSGEAVAPDEGCTGTYAVRTEGAKVFLKL